MSSSKSRPAAVDPLSFGPGRGRPGAEESKVKDRGLVVKRLWGYLRAFSGRLILITVLVALVTVLQLGGPFIQGQLIDHAIIPGDLALLARYLVALVVLYIAISLLSLLQQWSMISLSQGFIQKLRSELFARIQVLPVQYHDTTPHGDTMSRVTNDIDTINQTFSASLPQLVSSALTIVGVVVMMFVVNWQLAIVTLVTIPAVAMVTRTIARKTRTGFKAQRKTLGELNATVEETVSGLRAVILFRRQKARLKRFAAENGKLRMNTIRAQVFAGLMGPVMNFMRNVNYAIVAFAGGLFALNGWATVGVVVIFLQYARQFAMPLNQIAQLYSTIQSALAGAERVFETLDQESEPVDTPGLPALTDGRKSVQFSNVSFSYVAGQPVLENVSLDASPGETVALVGPTGAGKTTIINLLTRFYDVDSGSIRVDDRDVREIPRDSLRDSLGIVLQDNFLFSDTVMENIRYGRLDATDEEVVQAARLSYADHFVTHLPHQYQTLLSEAGSNLSQGQRQLLSIARAILSRPTILVLDEATSSVDTRTEVHIQKAMLRLMDGRTTFIIAHRLNTIRNADKIVVIDGGKVVEQGSHEELLERKGAYAELYLTQFSAVG